MAASAPDGIVPAAAVRRLAHGPFPAAVGFYFELLSGTAVALVGLLLTSLPPFAIGR